MASTGNRHLARGPNDKRWVMGHLLQRDRGGEGGRGPCMHALAEPALCVEKQK